MNRTCVDCTVFDPGQGMEGHPVFTTDLGWSEHRWKSHGGPRPILPSTGTSEPGTASKGFPPASPGGGSGVTVAHESLERLELQHNNLVLTTDERLRALEQQIYDLRILVEGLKPATT